MYIKWVKTSLFIIPGTLPTLKLPFITEEFFSDVVLVSNYHGCKGEAIILIPYYMTDIIYKTVKLSYLKKTANHTKYKKPDVPSDLYIF